MRPKKTLLLGAVVSAVALSYPAASISQAPLNPPASPRGLPSFADIIERVAPAVVSVEVRRQVAQRVPTIPGFPFELFPEGARPPREARAAGSGFFISADGYIVTNSHVVAGATEITVTLQDKRELTAKVVGRDEPTDLAVLKVEGKGFPYVSFANAARPRVGDWVIAVGNPFGLGGTATSGIVSAYGRDIGSTFLDYIQIDAPINRGNSGGPTFDAQGRVIGVNSMIFSPSGGSVGIGFAIPADVAQQVTRELIANGRIVRGYIGATVQTLTPDMADSLGISGRKGAVVADVSPGGPAERAGLQSGDVVVRLNGGAVENASQLTRQVAATRSGQPVRLEILRDGAARTIEALAGVRPSEEELAGLPSDRPSGEAGRLGITVRPLDPATRGRYGLAPALRGVVIDSVDPGSDAARKGLRPGDLIVRINTRPVTTTADVTAEVEAARRAGRDAVLVFLYRNGHQAAVPVQLVEDAAGGARP